MTPQERRELRLKLKRTKWAGKKQTGKNPTKKEMSEALLHIAKTVFKETPRTNEPTGIAGILKGMIKKGEG